jgi:hypothetical protein
VRQRSIAIFGMTHSGSGRWSGIDIASERSIELRKRDSRLPVADARASCCGGSVEHPATSIRIASDESIMTLRRLVRPTMTLER